MRIHTYPRHAHRLWRNTHRTWTGGFYWPHLWRVAHTAWPARKPGPADPGTGDAGAPKHSHDIFGRPGATANWSPLADYATDNRDPADEAARAAPLARIDTIIGRFHTALTHLTAGTRPAPAQTPTDIAALTELPAHGGQPAGDRT